jgi:lysophospholipase L1-like esterase
MCAEGMSMIRLQAQEEIHVINRCNRTWLSAAVAGLLVISAACGNSPAVPPDGAPPTDSGPGSDSGGGSDAEAGVSVALSESAFTLATPDLSRTLTANVTGSADKAVTWSSSNTYIATVSAAGVVTSVSGGQAVITATLVADPTKTATSTVTIPEPNRPRADLYIDARSITSGPVNVLMCGDSLMRTYVPNADDQAGWGQVLDQFLNTTVTVDNSFPNGGRSSRSFYSEAGRWDRVKASLAAARTAGTPTFVLIQFAHNDQKKTTDTDGPDFLTFASHNQNGTVAGTYYDYLERYIVETRELGGIPILVTPVVRENLEGSPATINATGLHNITQPYPGETAARGDYPAAMKAVAAKHDVPIVDITAWSKDIVEARAAASTLGYFYIAADHTHIRELGALLVAQEVVRALNEQGILTSYAKSAPARLMMDTSTLPFGGIFVGQSIDSSFRLTPFGDASGTITITAPTGYTVSTDGSTFDSSVVITADPSYAGSTVAIRFSPTDAIVYNDALTVVHSSLTLDYGNTAPGPVPGVISLTGNGRAVVAGAPATATWPMFSGTSINRDPTPEGAITATRATLTGLDERDVKNGGARFDIPSGSWPAEGARNPDRYVEFTVPITAGTFTLASISLFAGSGGGSNMQWDIVYSTAPDFSSPTDLGTTLGGPKDTLVMNNYPSLGLNIPAGQTLRLRVYPYNRTVGTGKFIMLANVVISGVTN